MGPLKLNDAFKIHKFVCSPKTLFVNLFYFIWIQQKTACQQTWQHIIFDTFFFLSFLVLLNTSNWKTTFFVVVVCRGICNIFIHGSFKSACKVTAPNDNWTQKSLNSKNVQKYFDCTSALYLDAKYTLRIIFCFCFSYIYFSLRPLLFFFTSALFSRPSLSHSVSHCSLRTHRVCVCVWVLEESNFSERMKEKMTRTKTAATPNYYYCRVIEWTNEPASSATKSTMHTHANQPVVRAVSETEPIKKQQQQNETEQNRSRKTKKKNKTITEKSG